MKKLLLVLCTIGTIIFILFLLFYVFVLSGAFAILMPEPTEPQITYGEFPFSITYEINNEIKVYEDVVVCQYEGIEHLGTGGKRRKWSGKLKSGNEHIVLLRATTNNTPFEIYEASPGLPEFYMGEFKESQEEQESYMKDDRYLGYKQGDIDRTITKEEAWEKYRVRVINIEWSPPIENKFE